MPAAASGFLSYPATQALGWPVQPRRARRAPSRRRADDRLPKPANAPIERSLFACDVSCRRDGPGCPHPSPPPGASPWHRLPTSFCLPVPTQWVGSPCGPRSRSCRSAVLEAAAMPEEAGTVTCQPPQLMAGPPRMAGAGPMAALPWTVNRPPRTLPAGRPPAQTRLNQAVHRRAAALSVDPMAAAAAAAPALLRHLSVRHPVSARPSACRSAQASSVAPTAAAAPVALARAGLCATAPLAWPQPNPVT